MRSTLLATCTLVCCAGCTVIADLGSFHVVDDDGGVDSGPSDSGTSEDACVATTFYRDADGDGYGDLSQTMEVCVAPTGYVDVAGDCDDTSRDVSPAATEVCDGVDQNCDGTADEGLMGALGPSIEVQADIGAGGWTTGIVAHRTGIVVMWHTTLEDVLRATFYDLDGNALTSDVFVRGIGTTSQVMARFDRAGLDQILFAWAEGGEVRALLCSTSGVCGTRIDTIATAPGTVDRLAIEQLGERVIVTWRDGDGVHVTSFNPDSGSAGSPITLPDVAGATGTAFTGLATIEGSEPSSLVPRTSFVLDGTTVTSSQTDLLRIHGDSVLSFDESMDAFPWDTTGRCGALGRESCSPAILLRGRGRAGSASLVLFEGLTGRDADGTTSSAACLFGLTPNAAGSPEAGPCSVVPLNRMGFATRGAVVTVVEDLDIEWGIRDVPLSGAAPSAYTSLAAYNYVYGLSMAEDRGALTARVGGTDLTLVRLGCTP